VFFFHAEPPALSVVRRVQSAVLYHLLFLLQRSWHWLLSLCWLACWLPYWLAGLQADLLADLLAGGVAGWLVFLSFNLTLVDTHYLQILFPWRNEKLEAALNLLGNTPIERLQPLPQSQVGQDQDQERLLWQRCRERHPRQKERPQPTSSFLKRLLNSF